MTHNTTEIPIRYDNATSIHEAMLIYQRAIADWHLWYRKQLIMFGVGPRKEINIETQLINDILESMALRYGVTVEAIKSKSRKEGIVLIRTCVAYTLVYRYDFSRKAVGRAIGRDHSTIISCLKKGEIWVKIPTAFSREVSMLRLVWPEKFEK